MEQPTIIDAAKSPTDLAVIQVKGPTITKEPAKTGLDVFASTGRKGKSEFKMPKLSKEELENAAKSPTDLAVIHVEGPTITKEPAKTGLDVFASTGRKGKSEFKMPKLSKEEVERIKRRLTLAPGKTAEDFRPISYLDSFCKKSHEAIKMGLDESSVGLLNVTNHSEEDRRKSVGGPPASEVVMSAPSGISWRDELKALKEELALPASVSLRISGMEMVCDNNTSDNYSNNTADGGENDGIQKDEETTINLVINTPSPPPALLKDIDLDFLSTLGSGLIDRNLARQSMMIFFDPVVEKALKEPNHLGDQRKVARSIDDVKKNIPSLVMSSSTGQTKDNSEEESVQWISAVQNQITNNRKRDIKELNGLIEKLMLEIEEQENKSEMPEVLSTSEQTELLLKLDVEIQRMHAELIEQPIETQQLVEEIDECDKIIAQLNEDMEIFEADKKKLLEEKMQDKNSHKEHLEYMEDMFDNMYQNYLRAKESRKGLIHNKTVLEKHNQHLTQVDNQFKENFQKIKAEHELHIMRAKKELASKEAEIRELKKHQAQKIIHSH